MMFSSQIVAEVKLVAQPVGGAGITHRPQCVKAARVEGSTNYRVLGGSGFPISIDALDA
jgi:hypothetical protein